MKSPAPVVAAPSVLLPESDDYPAAIRQFFGKHLPAITTLGNPNLLKTRLVALFCSIRCPGDVILKLYDLVRAARDAGIPVIGGFHTPMEKECLALLLRGTQPMVTCPARSIAQMRLPADWQQSVTKHRLLILSPFEAKHRRPTVELTEQRNRFVAALSAHTLIAHAAPKSKTEALCLEILRQNKQVFALVHSTNDHLLAAGTRAATITALRTVVARR